MTHSELISPSHLQLKAIIYIRQSSPHQVISHQESLKLQYALKQRALGLGWLEAQIQLIDCDLGFSGAYSEHREGFKELLSEVTLGHVGIIISIEVQRLCRNCSDWYPLLDICAYKGCLIADSDGLYDPSTPNGRLLLGIKGQLSELELHTIRNRMTAGLINKAQRGELALTLPTGLIRTPQNVVQKDPNQEVQQRISLVFDTFLRLRSASKVLRFFVEEQLTIPRRNHFGDLVWKSPTTAAILSILKNPAYAGCFVYGKTRVTAKRTSFGKAQSARLPMEQWKIMVKDKYPAYLSWETFESIQATLKDNYAEYDRNKARGVPREGATLLQGIVYCGQCGHKMVTQYKPSPRYLCNYLRGQHATPVCQFLPADPVDHQVVESFFQVISQASLDLYQQAIEEEQQVEQKTRKAHQQQLQRLRYQVALAQRQFDQVDPDNRLVADELEKRWEAALRELKQAELVLSDKENTGTLPPIPQQMQETFKDIGKQLPSLWRSEKLSTPHKKALLRCLVDKTIIHRKQRDQIHLRLVWKGGETSSFDILIPVGSCKELHRCEEMEQRIIQLASQQIEDQAIAQKLTKEGFRSPMKETLLPSTVRTIRLKHRILRLKHQSHPRKIAGFLTVSQIARELHLPPHWLYDRIKKGVILVTKDPKTSLYLFPDCQQTWKRFSQLKKGEVKQINFIDLR